MNKFTQGPWEVSALDNSIVAGNCRIFDTPDDYDEATGKWRELTQEEKANLQLVASAPDMYEALKHYLELDKDGIFTETYALASKAIAKAEGGNGK